MIARLIGVCLCLAGLGLGCVYQTAREPQSALTLGMTKKHIIPGKTTQTDVLEVFGPPDLVTRKEGREVWTYDKIAHEVSASGGFLTIFIAGTYAERASRTTRSIMLIIYFDGQERVIDYKLSAAKF